MNLSGYFLDRNPPDKIAILCAGRTFTYAGMAVLANRAGNGLRALDVGPGDRVSLLLPDSPEIAATWLDAIKLSAVARPTNVTGEPIPEHIFREEWLAAQPHERDV